MQTRRDELLDSIAKTIVDRRNLFFLFYIIMTIFSLFSMGWVNVEEDIVNYLPKESRTRQSIAIMEREFQTFGMANVMISNISYSHAKDLAEKIEKIPGVDTVMFDNSDKHYKNVSSLFIITFMGEDTDEVTLNALEEVEYVVSPYDYSISTTIGEDMAAQLTEDMTLIGILASIVIIIVLLITSQSYAEVPVLLITFGVAALLNMGTNFLFGKVSFISNSVAAVLQLALAIDYAIILCHRFTEENEMLPAREAAIIALKKAIPEISSSSLTTIAGLGALAFMKFGIGKDLAAVMIKAILLSMLSVFTLMPGLLVLFSGLIHKTKHKRFIPSVSILGRFSIKTRYIIPPIFIVVLVLSLILSTQCPFAFSLSDIRGHRLSESQIAEDRIKENFGSSNMVALMVPAGDYDAEKRLLTKISEYEEVDSAIGLANTEAMGGYMLADALNPRQFSELVDLDYEIAQLLYSAYAIGDEDYGKIISGLGQYEVPLIDMIQFSYEQVSEGFVTLDEELIDELESSYSQLANARSQMQSEDFSRMMLVLNLPMEGDQTYDFLSTIYREAGKYYEESSIYLAGDSTNSWDLSSTFDKDNLIISILSVLFVVIILTFTFQSAGLPFLLIAVIQASIWINFSVPYLKNQPIYFLGFLLVSSIQMGANIDYAIVMSSRYFALKEELPRREAVIEALNQGFPTIITSGTILAVAGILIGRISTDGATAVLGSYLGYGTIISMILVIFVLPQLLYLGDIIVEKTSFKLNLITSEQKAKQGRVQINGRLKGFVEGEIDAYVEGSVTGKVHGIIEIDTESSETRRELMEGLNEEK
ncbi:MAG: MMPL family transporter [Clostridiales bacterium]|nr:MMPL family transporter [Clostridiales bacterium]